MFDLLDILRGKATRTLPGSYYKTKPEAMSEAMTPDELMSLSGGIPIDYEIVDPMSRHYKALLGDIMDGDGATLTICTCDRCPFSPKQYIATADGRLYMISSVTEDTSKSSKEAMRYIPVPLDAEYVLRLIEVDNPRRIY